MMRHRELEAMIPRITALGTFVMLVTSAVIPIPKQASVIAKGIDGDRPAPGLMSVPNATGTVRSISSRGRKSSSSWQAGSLLTSNRL